jgi:hypothetical protein
MGDVRAEAAGRDKGHDRRLETPWTPQLSSESDPPDALPPPQYPSALSLLVRAQPQAVALAAPHRLFDTSHLEQQSWSFLRI